MNKKKLLFIFGTRPEFIKVYPVILEAKKQGNEVVIVNTGQHKEMLDSLLEYFDLTVDYNLAVMNQVNGLTEILTVTLTGLNEIIGKERPDLVLVHGDTSATLAGSIAAFYNQVKLAHIEAGLRTYNKYSPFPEEVNRQLTGVIADYHFAPTTTAQNHLLQEGKPAADVFVVGNSAIDMLQYTLKEDYQHPILTQLEGKKLILITAHRRENLEALTGIFRAINRLAIEHGETCEFVYPIHMNPVIREKARQYLTAANIKIVDPLNTIDFHNIMNYAHLILTDSGGIQEEAPALGIPVLVLRDTTERPEGVEAGTLKLVGTDEEKIVLGVNELLGNQTLYNQMKQVKNPYGDGTTSQQIMGIINHG
ncbi:MAG: non-hydrolyzing UDP-N-acetylglucosamine 2-epimerase [Enterococcus sp.]